MFPSAGNVWTLCAFRGSCGIDSEAAIADVIVVWLIRQVHIDGIGGCLFVQLLVLRAVVVVCGLIGGPPVGLLLVVAIDVSRCKFTSEIFIVVSPCTPASII